MAAEKCANCWHEKSDHPYGYCQNEKPGRRPYTYCGCMKYRPAKPRGEE